MALYRAIEGLFFVVQYVAEILGVLLCFLKMMQIHVFSVYGQEKQGVDKVF